MLPGNSYTRPLNYLQMTKCTLPNNQMQIINKYVNLKLTELTCLNVLPENPRLWAILENHKAALLVPIYLKEETKNITVTNKILNNFRQATIYGRGHYSSALWNQRFLWHIHLIQDMLPSKFLFIASILANIGTHYLCYIKSKTKCMHLYAHQFHWDDDTWNPNNGVTFHGERSCVLA